MTASKKTTVCFPASPISHLVVAVPAPLNIGFNLKRRERQTESTCLKRFLIGAITSSIYKPFVRPLGYAFEFSAKIPECKGSVILAGMKSSSLQSVVPLALSIVASLAVAPPALTVLKYGE